MKIVLPIQKSFGDVREIGQNLSPFTTFPKKCLFVGNEILFLEKLHDLH
jgi:hypothetical protein